MEILYFTLIFSKEKKKGRSIFRVINAYSFDKKFEIKRNDGNGKIRLETISHPTRKIFYGHIQELLSDKLLVKLPIRDNKSRWYSITPLGICQLIKSDFLSSVKRSSPETDCMIHVLLSFATPNIKSHESLIFGNKNFFSRDTNFLEDLKNTDMPRSGNMANVFSNIDFENTKFSFYVTNGYYEENKLVLARGSFNHKRSVKHTSSIQSNLVQVIELNKRFRHLRSDLSYEPLLLDEDQFHHYFANLLLCSLIYRNAIVTFDMDRVIRHSHTSKRKNAQKLSIKEYSEYWKYLPEYFQRIISLFSNHATVMVNEQANLMTDFSRTIR